MLVHQPCLSRYCVHQHHKSSLSPVLTQGGVTTTESLDYTTGSQGFPSRNRTKLHPAARGQARASYWLLVALS
jgi:hypothetical protein